MNSNSNQSNLRQEFVEIVRLGIGIRVKPIPKQQDWAYIQNQAIKQGLNAIVLDGIGQLPNELKPSKENLLTWIGTVIKEEGQFANQQKAAVQMSLLFHRNCIRTYVLKGFVIAECYPNANHRLSCDMDCMLIPTTGSFDAWERGNQLIEKAGFEVRKDYYKNSTFYLPGLMVENHLFMLPFRGNKKLKELESLLQKILKQDRGDNLIAGTCLNRPPTIVMAVFLIEHAYSHFFNEGLTWRHILDWMMYKNKHKEQIEWDLFNSIISEYGFKDFYNSYERLGEYMLGEIEYKDLTNKDLKMLDDVWADLDLHDTYRGFKGKLALAGNTWRSRWKYKEFSELSMLQSLWIQIKGFFFIRHPKLN